MGFGLAVSCAAATCAIAAILVGKRVRSRRKWRRVVGVLRDLEEACETSVGRLRQVVDAMAVEMHAGLASEGGSKLKMLLTFVDKLPNGYSLLKLLVLLVGGFMFSLVCSFPGPSQYLLACSYLLCLWFRFSDLWSYPFDELSNGYSLLMLLLDLVDGFELFWAVYWWVCRCVCILPIVSILSLWLCLFDSCFGAFGVSVS